MKKLLCILLCIMLILTSTITAFATSAPVNSTSTAIVKLNITSSEDDLAYIKKYQTNAKASLSKEDNSFMLQVNEVEEKGNKAFITGKAVAKMFGETYELIFNSREFSINEANGVKFYSGCIEDKCNETGLMLVDITTTADFKKAVASVTVYTESETVPVIMLYGDTFKEQISLFNQELQRAQTATSFATNEAIDTERNSQSVRDVAGIYEHVGSTSSSILAGTTTNKEMVVLDVAKCDPRDLGTGVNGFEFIRVFSRSYNVPLVDSSILYARPSRVNVTFNGDSNLSGVILTTPGRTDISTPPAELAFLALANVYASVTGNVGVSVVAEVAALISDMIRSSGDTVAFSENTATFDISLLNISNYTNIDLPSTTTCVNASTDQTRGLGFEVVYIKRPSSTAATVTVTASMTYQGFLETHRTISIKSGNATKSHKVYSNVT